MKAQNILLYLLLAVSVVLIGCNDEPELKFDIIESPVLAMFDGQSFPETAPVDVTATFYDLDKSGILDQNVGIDSIPVAGLNITVFIDESVEIGTFTTDASGTINFSKSWAELGGATSNLRLEWVGSFDSKPFRIYHIVTVE
ncbi:hypothetical protein [Flexithrix dorotheae]|uniref:hypothetical protein n=1 Tax=Flexithrix dorotheae TaxID=70993 RepID=UPI000365E05B|nr:hypothetical protein [Flexithrix dorotheae]